MAAASASSPAAADDPALAARFAALAAASPRLVLGTASASRRGVVDALAADYPGFKGYEVLKPDIDEKAIRRDDPRELVLALAHAKADAVLALLAAQQQQQQQQQQQHKEEEGGEAAAAGAGQEQQQQGEGGAGGGGAERHELVVTCDQVVTHLGAIREKPADEAEAHRFIHSYARAPAQTVGAVVVTDLRTRRRVEAVEVCAIHMRDMPDDVIDALVAEGDVMWCAGGLMVEHALVQPYLVRIDGTVDAVMGLGREMLMRLLLEAAGM